MRPRSTGTAAHRIAALLGVLPALLLAGSAAAQQGSPAGAVPVERLEARRQALLERMGVGVAVVRASSLRDLDDVYPQDSDFRQANDFFYLTGLEVADATLVLVARRGGGDEVTLYIPRRDPRQERWTGPKLGPGPEAASLTGIADVRPAERLQSEFGALLAGGAASSGGLWLDRTQMRACERPDPSGACVVEAPDGVVVRPLATHLDALRLVKDPDELRRLRTAIDITMDALRAAMRAAEPGMYEYEIEAIIEYVFRKRGAERVGFPSIVGSGINSTVLHYDKNRRRTEPGDVVVVDVGAEYGYYTADITRTFPVSGRFTPRQRALYELVLASQQAAIDSVRPGVTVQDLTRIARTYMREHSGDLCGPASCERYFVHGLSHWLGMDVHDVGGYRTPLAPGMVLTIEPGIYIPDERIGIRIEDDVLVTGSGHEVLSGALPRHPDAVEQLMAEPSTFQAAGAVGDGG